MERAFHKTARLPLAIAIVLIVSGGALLGWLISPNAPRPFQLPPAANEDTRSTSGPEISNQGGAQNHPPQDGHSKVPTNLHEGTDDPDIVLVVRLPAACVDRQEIRVTTAATSIDTVLSNGEQQRFPLLVPDAGLPLRISGAGVMPMVGGLRREGQTLHLLTIQELTGDSIWKQRNHETFGDGFDATNSHPAGLIQGKPLSRGDELHIELLPLVQVTAGYEDANGNAFRAGITSVVWTVPGQYTVYSPKEQTVDAEMRWLVPVGASLNLEPAAGAATEPERYAGVTLPPSPKLHLPFVTRAASLRRIRVVSQDDTPLEGARFRPDVRSASVIGAGLRDALEGGEYILLVGSKVRELAIWAPHHIPMSVLLSDIPQYDGEHRVVLRKAPPATIVSVDFGSEDPGAHKPVIVRTAKSDASWGFDQELPQDGELVLHSEAPVSVSLISEWYDFEKLERKSADRVRVERYKAHRKIGIVLEAVNSLQHSWLKHEPIHVTISRPMPEDGPQQVALNGSELWLSVGERKLAPVAPGTWIIHAFQNGDPRLSGSASVTVAEDTVIASISPSGPWEWLPLKIVDLTGRCNAKGTTFVAGKLPLAALEGARDRSLERADRVRLWMENDRPESITISRTAAGCSVFFAYADGQVLAPAWVEGRVAVLPIGEFSVFEGVLDSVAGTITVQAPAWAREVSFLPHTDAGAEQLALLGEAGWFVSIREATGDGDLRIIDGSSFKVSAFHGKATVTSLPFGTYVARFIRLGVEESVDPQTGGVRQTARLEWLDPVRFELDSLTAQVQLPVSRN